MPGSRAPWWMYVVGAAFYSYAFLTIYVWFFGPEPVGIRATPAGSRLVVKKVFPESPAARAGIEPGDRIVTANDRRVASGSDWRSVLANLEANRPVPVRIERAGEPLELILRCPRLSWGAWWRSNGPVGIATLTMVLICLVLCAVFVVNRPRDPVARLGALFVAWGTVVTLFPPPDGWATALRQLPAPLAAFVVLPLACAMLSCSTVLQFTCVFPRKLFQARWISAMVWLPAIAITPVHAYNFVYLPAFRPGEATGTPVWPDAANILLLVLYMTTSVVCMVTGYRRLQDRNERRRVRVLVAGAVIGGLGYFPSVFSRFPAPPVYFSFPAPVVVVSALMFLSVPIAWAYAILRHRVLDIRLIIRQTLRYAVARGAFLAFAPLMAGLLLADLLRHGDQPLLAIVRERGWIYLALAALALLAQARRRQWLDALDRRFFREHYDAQRLLREVVEEVRRANRFEDVAPRVVSQIETALHPEFAALLLREREEASYRILAAAPAGHGPPALPAHSKLLSMMRVLGKPIELSPTSSSWLEQQLPHEETDFIRQARIEWLVPIATDPNGTEALLAAGSKRSEEPYTQDDQDLLGAIAASLGLLLEKHVPLAAPPPCELSEVFEECPTCGACYDTGAGLCAKDAAPLDRVQLPRLLAQRYRLDRRLGRGGMGTVYQAVDISLDRRVAAKVIREDLVGNAEMAERFRREARLSAGFTHPNVVTVHDFGVAGGKRAFLVMELLEGVNLREELEGHKRLEPQRALEILRGVCSGVQAAHRRPLIHRDLKPENIFLSRGPAGEEVPKILDFGVAKLLSADEATQSAALATGVGALVGTLRYMSPEQLRGEMAQPSWDLWALAVVAYETLVGRYPFAGPSAAEWHRAVLNGTFTPITDHPCWQEFFIRALAPDAQYRPASARVFFSELEQAIGAVDLPIAAAPTRAVE